MKMKAIDVFVGLFAAANFFGLYNTSLGEPAAMDSLLDLSFTPHVESNVSALAVQPDGKLLIGWSRWDNDVTRGFVARLNPDGAPDGTFNPSVEAIGSPHCSTGVSALAVSQGGILVGGNFVSFNGSKHLGIVKLTPAGA